MSKFEAIAAAFEQSESETLAKVGEELKRVDRNTAKRTDALGEMLDATLDAVEAVQGGIDKLLAHEADDSKDKAEEIEKKRHMARLERIEAGVLAIPSQIDIPEVDIEKYIAPLAKRIMMLEMNQEDLMEKLNNLLTARRLPEFDKDGNVVAVRLEK